MRSEGKTFRIGGFHESLRLLCLEPASFLGWLGVIDAQIAKSSQSNSPLILQRVVNLESSSLVSLLEIARRAIKSGQKIVAIQCLLKSLAIDPSCPGLNLDLGAMLEASSQDNLAAYFYGREATLSPADPRPWFNLGNVAMASGDPTASAHNYDEALNRGLTSTFVYKAAALAHLVAGNFSRGWDLYESRFFSGDLSTVNSARMLASTRPLLGKSLNGYENSSVLVWAEQGVGDEIMFGSMLKELYPRVKRLVVQIDIRLIPLFRRSFPPDVLFFDRNVSVPEANYDAHVAIGSVGKYVRPTVDSFEKSRRYLIADAGLTSKIRASMNLGRKDFVIGISWYSGNRDTGHVRSISLVKMVEALMFSKVKIVNLQYGAVEEEIRNAEASMGIDIIRCPCVDNTNNLDGLASLVEACDEVVSIGNATAHLAGALGKKTTVLLPKLGVRTAEGAVVPGWRWLGNAGRCVWYEGVDLLKWETHESNWDGCLERLRENFATRLANHG